MDVRIINDYKDEHLLTGAYLKYAKDNMIGNQNKKSWEVKFSDMFNTQVKDIDVTPIQISRREEKYNNQTGKFFGTKVIEDKEITVKIRYLLRSPIDYYTYKEHVERVCASLPPSFYLNEGYNPSFVTDYGFEDVNEAPQISSEELNTHWTNYMYSVYFTGVEEDLKTSEYVEFSLKFQTAETPYRISVKRTLGLKPESLYKTDELLTEGMLYTSKYLHDRDSRGNLLLSSDIPGTYGNDMEDRQEFISDGSDLRINTSDSTNRYRLKYPIKLLDGDEQKVTYFSTFYSDSDIDRFNVKGINELVGFFNNYTYTGTNEKVSPEKEFDYLVSTKQSALFRISYCYVDTLNNKLVTKDFREGLDKPNTDWIVAEYDQKLSKELNIRKYMDTLNSYIKSYNYFAKAKSYTFYVLDIIGKTDVYGEYSSTNYTKSFVSYLGNDRIYGKPLGNTYDNTFSDWGKDVKIDRGVKEPPIIRDYYY